MGLPTVSSPTFPRLKPQKHHHHHHQPRKKSTLRPTTHAWRWRWNNVSLPQSRKSVPWSSTVNRWSSTPGPRRPWKSGGWCSQRTSGCDFFFEGFKTELFRGVVWRPFWGMMFLQRWKSWQIQGESERLVCFGDGFNFFHVLTGHLSYFVPTNTQEIQDQTKNVLSDGPCKGFPTTNGQSLVCRLPGIIV